MKRAILRPTTFTILSLFCSSVLYARSVFLNGQDVSSTRSKYLKKVNVRIDENGDVFIEAPHYQVHEESTYQPLSTWAKDHDPQTLPNHANPGSLPRSMNGRGTLEKVPAAGELNPATSDIATQVDKSAVSEAPVDTGETKLEEKSGQ